MLLTEIFNHINFYSKVEPHLPESSARGSSSLRQRLSNITKAQCEDAIFVHSSFLSLYAFEFPLVKSIGKWDITCREAALDPSKGAKGSKKVRTPPLVLWNDL